MPQLECQKRAKDKYRKKMHTVTIWLSPRDDELYNWIKNKGEGLSTAAKAILKKAMEDERK